MSQAIIDALGHDTETSHNSPKSLARIPLSFLPSEVIRAIYRWGPDSLTSVLTRGDKSIRMTGPAILVRVDDFPRWDLKFEDFVQFDSIMAHYEVPYILGVTPKCEFHRGSPRSLTVDELRFLHERVRENGIELALHGFTHQPRNFRGLLTEIATYSEAELRAQLIRMDMWFDSVRLPRPRVFVPPFNTFTQQNYVVLDCHWRVELTLDVWQVQTAEGWTLPVPTFVRTPLRASASNSPTSACAFREQLAQHNHTPLGMGGRRPLSTTRVAN